MILNTKIKEILIVKELLEIIQKIRMQKLTKKVTTRKEWIMEQVIMNHIQRVMKQLMDKKLCFKEIMRFLPIEKWASFQVKVVKIKTICCSTKKSMILIEEKVIIQLAQMRS
jgi:hypothetical protein